MDDGGTLSGNGQSAAEDTAAAAQGPLMTPKGSGPSKHS
jgi:hypothetical protein